MKVEIEIIGHAPKQKAQILKRLEDFVSNLSNEISIGTAKIKEVGGKKRAKQIQ